MSPSVANPYAKWLDGRDAVDVIRETPGRLETIIETLDSEQLNRSPAPGKWSVREILCHLADVEVSFAFRLRQALAEDHHVIQPFDEKKWAVNYGTYDAGSALAVFSALRRWDLILVAALKPDDLARSVNHPERGDMSIKTMLETRAGHDLNHLAQIEAIRV